MAFKFLLVGAFLIAGLQEIHGHGKLMDPVNRSSAWRKGFKTPPNYSDNQLYCGGLGVQNSYGGKCGACGDSYGSKQPRPNENGGYYGTGTIVKTYKSGQKFTAIVNLSANHGGYYTFALCPLNGPKDIETEECFAAHPVLLADGSEKYKVPRNNGNHEIDLVLPEGLTCDHCSFRWNYKAANNWGMCEDGKGRLGCGAQETFRGCADITIQ